MRLFIQSGKVNASKKTITKLQGEDRFSEEYTSYVTSITPNNRYADPANFFSWMERSPKKWDKKFIFIGAFDSNARIKQASIDAIRIAQAQTRKYGVDSGHLLNSLWPFINGRMINNPVEEFANAGSGPVFTLLNAAEYGATSETNALFYAKIGGIIYYTAKAIQRRYPELGVSYYYTEAAKVGASHKYQLPTLAIGPASTVTGGLARPGSRRKARAGRNRRRTARRADYAARADRLNAAGRRGDYG